MTHDLFADRPDRASWDQPTHVARQGVVTLAHDVLRSIGGDEALTRRPMVPTMTTATIMRTVATDPAQGIAVVMRLREEIDQQIGWCVGDARGLGLSWAELAAPLGVQPDSDGGDDSLALRAWNRYRELAVTEDARNGLMFWGCQSCRNNVLDYGPLHDNPQENEHGHAADCDRHQREIGAWLAAQGPAEETSTTDPTTH